MRPVLVTKSRVYEPLRYPFRSGVHSPHSAPRHCSSSSRMTASIKTRMALTARFRMCWRKSCSSGIWESDDSPLAPSEVDVLRFLDTGIVPSLFDGRM